MKTKRFVSTLLALLLICGLPLSAFAEEYDLAQGSVTVNATESGQTVTHGSNAAVPDSAPVITQSDSSTPTTNTVTIKAEENATANVTIQDVNIVISDPVDAPEDHSGQAAVTIDVADGASANVTLDGVNIDVSGTGKYGNTAYSGEAAVQITGNGNVTLELDGENTLQGGNNRAAVEKNTTDDSGKGELTITDENETHGSLKATGGSSAAGIGGSTDSSASNITISGNAEVTAKGGKNGAGIGGGPNGSGNGITITGNAKVTAIGGDLAAGIGGGSAGSGSNITVSEDAQVKAQGGDRWVNNNGFAGAGAAIGNGGAWNKDGAEVTLNNDALDEGWVATYAPGTENMDTAVPNSLTYKDASGTVTTATQGIAIEDAQSATCTEAGHEVGFRIDGVLVAVTIPATDHSFTNYVSDNNATYDHDGTKTAKCDHCNVTDTIPDSGSKLVREEVPQTAALYRVIDQDGKALACKTERKDGILTITVEADFAALTGKLGGIRTLKAQGVDTIVFVTKGASSTFALSDLLAQGSTGDSYTLTHDGSTVTFTLGAAKTDVSGILAKP